MRFELAPHPHDPAPPFTLGLRPSAAPPLGETATLNLWFGVSAPMSRFLVPHRAPARRRDNLWQSTCFECFLKQEGEVAYQEWNFSPSGDWAAYDFTAEREGMAPAEIASPPYIRTEDNLTWWGLGATLSIPSTCAFIPRDSAVEEEPAESLFFAFITLRAATTPPSDCFTGDCLGQRHDPVLVSTASSPTRASPPAEGRRVALSPSRLVTRDLTHSIDR
jgi:hypothetical protein